MLDELFAMKVNRSGELESLPLLLHDYTPDLDRLPLFLLRLGPEVSCIQTSGGAISHHSIG